MANLRREKVCVIGAGAAGLCAARHLAANAKFKVTVYEQTGKIGGTWVYEQDITDEDGSPVHSSMYRNLRTNLPARIMNFPDHMEMTAEEPCCVGHEDVLNYLKGYAERFDILRFIHFKTIVNCVRVERIDNQDVWFVEVKNLITDQTEVNQFDAVMVCNGHYFQPYIPPIDGLDSCRDFTFHSHYYRKPEPFSGKTVMVLGAASSGIDIALELSNYATRVYLSSNGRLESPLPENVHQVARVVRIDNSNFHLRDGRVVEDIEFFVLCTGYEYKFPFLDESCGIQVEDNYVSPLYKHLVNIEHPTMCLVGIPSIILPFALFHMQVQYFLAMLEGRVILPVKALMLKDAACKTDRKKDAHILKDKQWEYNKNLANDAGVERLPQFYELAYTKWSSKHYSDLMRYKDSRFVISGENVEITPPRCN